MFRCRRLNPFSILPLGLAAITAPVLSQSAPEATGSMVFKASARTAVIDVVVADRKGRPVEHLPRESFVVEEDGKPQQITSFEEHAVSPAPPTPLPDLPPDIFTNVPRIKPAGAVTVLLLDGLNTELQDQSRVRAEMVKYLEGLQPGRRVAIFTLGNRLSFVQGFTDDSALLIAALKNPKRGATPQSSAVLQSSQEIAADQKATTNMAEHAAAAAAVLQQFQAEQRASQTSLRIDMTLQAFREMANYLAAIPGRKNVVWFSSAFPSQLFGNADLRDSFAVQGAYGEQIRETNALMAAVQMAIYPVAAEGLVNGSLIDVSQQFGAVVSGQSPTQPPPPQGTPLGQQANTQQSNALQADSVQRNANHTTMDEVARATGGQAFYNTNGLNDALAKVIDHGSYFYTISYTPTEAAADGRFRKIEVKLAHSGEGYKLTYRHGYYAPDAKDLRTAATKPAGDPLHPFMGLGMPNSTQIPLAFRVLPHPAGAAHAGDNPSLKVPLKRYSVDFVIAASGLQLEPADNGGRHGTVEATLVIYDQNGAGLNWIVRAVNLDLDAKRYTEVQSNGVNFRLEIDAPQNGLYLRGGVYDLLSRKAGTLEVPLSSVVAPPTAASQ